MLQVTHRPWRDFVARVDSQEFWDGLLPGLKPRPTGRVELGDANLILKGDGGSFDPLQFPSVGSGENQLREFGRPYGAYLVGWGYDPRATPSATLRVALGYSRQLPPGATGLVGESPWVHGVRAIRADGPTVSDTLFHFRYFRDEMLHLRRSQHLAWFSSAVQSQHELHTRLEARACFKRPIPQGAL